MKDRVGVYFGSEKDPTLRLRKASLSEVRERINRLRRSDTRTLSTEQLEARLGLIMDAYRTMTGPVRLNGAFRSRKNIGTELFKNVAELWYPPVEAILRRGRFNAVHEPLFYVCNTTPGAVMEVRPSTNDLITVACLRTVKQPFLELHCARIGLDRSASNAFIPSQRIDLPARHPAFQASLREDNLTKKWRLVDEFLTEVSMAQYSEIDEQEKYRLTNIISKTLFRIPGIDCLTYPSIATRFKNMNIAIKPDVADKEFKIVETWLLEIGASMPKLPGAQADDGPFVQVRFLRRSKQIGPDGEIVWGDELTNVEPHEIAHLAPSHHPSVAPPWGR